MQRRVTSLLLSLLGAAALPGCGGALPPPDVSAAAAPSPAAPRPEKPVRLSTADHVATNDKADHFIVRDDTDIVMQLDIYQLTVPSGAISTSERFWKHVDEDHVTLATHALLLENGVRYGIAPNDEWDYFKTLMDRYGATARKGSTAPVKKGSLELPLRTNIDSQNIFYLREINHRRSLYGRTYEKCDNLLALTFEPTPRRPGDARIAVCALVRGLRKQFEVSVLNEAREIELRNPEYLYDMRFREDVPLDHFLVIAPAPLSSMPDSLGHTFFVRPGGAEPMETVLLLVPRPFHLSGNDPAGKP